MTRWVRFASLLLALLMALGCAAAQEADEGTGFDITALSIEELLQLRIQIHRRLIELGYNPFFDISRGERSEAVANLQARLKELGYLTGAVSGQFNSETQRAQKQFERANGLKEDGIASREDQMALYSAQAVGKPTPTPAPTSAPAATPGGVPVDASAYGVLDYSDALRYPEKHAFTNVCLTGLVVQVMGSRMKGFQIRLQLSGSSDVVFLEIDSDPGYNILVNDRLTVYGQMMGTVTYTSTWKQEITIPRAVAHVIVLR